MIYGSLAMYDTCDTDSLITLSLVNLLKFIPLIIPVIIILYLFFQMDLGKLGEFPLEDNLSINKRVLFVIKTK